MALNPKTGTTARNNACNGAVDTIDSGPGNGYTSIYTGAPPANPQAASTGTLLAVVNHPKPAFGNAGAVTPGVASANAMTGVTALASGDAGYYRTFDSTGTNCHLQGTAGEAGDTPDMVFDDKSFVAGGTVTLTGYTVTMPEQ